MLGLIVTGHGNFASGMLSSLNLVVGKQENVIGVDFLDGDSTEDLEQKIKDAVEKLKEYKGIVFLTDIAGGSPFKTSVLVSMNMENSKVISGTNLPMLLETALGAGEEDSEKLKDVALAAGNTGIKCYENEHKSKKVNRSNGI